MTLPPSLSGAAHCRVTDLDVISRTTNFNGCEGGAANESIVYKPLDVSFSTLKLYFSYI